MTAHAELLRAASDLVGIESARAEVVRSRENTIYRLSGKIIARVNALGQEEAARREVKIARWLNENGIQAVKPLDVDHPVIDGHAVTFWHEFGAHKPGTARQVAGVLKRLHALPVPDFLDQKLTPFVRLHARITGATWLPEDDAQWLLEHLTMLEQRWKDRPVGMADAVLHGDAWAGNVIDVEGQGMTLIDLERFAIGPPEWDLTSTAVGLSTYSTLSPRDWADYSSEYGFDVTTWQGYLLLRDLREFRATCFAVHVAQTHHDLQHNAEYRIRCLRGAEGPRPWSWRPLS